MDSDYEEEDELASSVARMPPLRLQGEDVEDDEEYTLVDHDLGLGHSQEAVSELHANEYSPTAEEEELVVPGSVWDCQFIIKGDKWWDCGHCKKRFQGLNATKAKAHVARADFKEIANCRGHIPGNLLNMYKRQWKIYLDSVAKRETKKKAKEDLREDRTERGVDAMIAAGTSRKARRARGGSLSSINSASTSVHNQPRRGSTGSRTVGSGIQLYLTDKHPNSDKEELKMDYAISSFVLEGGHPYSTVDNEHFRHILKLAKTIRSDYVPPPRQKIAKEMLEHLYKQRYAENLKSVLRESDIFGLTIYGDGATIAKIPYFNILVAGVHNPAACLEIHDCTGICAEGKPRIHC